ncbi:unnamed protein product, partial [marine sediment metagenome]
GMTDSTREGDMVAYNKILSDVAVLMGEIENKIRNTGN